MIGYIHVYVQILFLVNWILENKQNKKNLFYCFIIIVLYDYILQLLSYWKYGFFCFFKLLIFYRFSDRLISFNRYQTINEYHSIALDNTFY